MRNGMNKKRWIEHYCELIFKAWQSWQTPLGVAAGYRIQIRRDLAGFYDDPIKRSFVESSY